MAEWPQRIPAQVLRTRLAAFKEELCDANFAQSPCASCCRLKRRCKLVAVTFPSPGSAKAPDWLPWGADAWLKHREAWYASMQDFFSVDMYLDRFFHVQGRLSAAQQGVLAFQNDSGFTPSFASLPIAEAWKRRVEQWYQNLLRDINSDSVASPADPNARWLLFPSACTPSPAETGAISCHLCKHCCAALSKVSGKDQKMAVHMPEMARANGMWHGPDPVELKVLSYAEAKVINLARIYVSVKRVFLDRSSYARTSAAEAPLYHQRNVVAYPQNPDAALKVLGMNPVTLAQTLQVQFVGENRSDLRHQPDLQVSVEKLRGAFHWLSLNSWPFMDATRDHELWETGTLDNSLEKLLEEYTKSTGTTSGGIPAELMQGACRIAVEHSSVLVAGPADCTASKETEDDEKNDVQEGHDETADNCAGVMDGGVDDISPVQIWDAVMKKYKVAQLCGQELELRNTNSATAGFWYFNTK